MSCVLFPNFVVMSCVLFPDFSDGRTMVTALTIDTM